MRNDYLEHAIIMLDKIEARVQGDFSALSRVQINWKPDAKSWSIAECLDHLIVTNEKYFERFDAVKNNTVKRPFLAGLPWWSGFCSKMILKSVDPETKKKVKTFALFQPTSSDFARTVLDEFSRNIRELKTYLHELDGFDNHQEIKFASPVTTWIVLDLENAVNIVWKHCARHLNQAARVMQATGFPSS
jgi:hypothetical protein